MKSIFVIIGSASANSANLKLVEKMEIMAEHEFKFTVFNNLKMLPHFDPELSSKSTPQIILEFRNSIQKADGVIICTPEYIQRPSGLKNAIEWCISTTVFSDKPCGLITASASGEKGHEELQLIMKTAMARFTKESTLLIKGVKGKIDSLNNINDEETIFKLKRFLSGLKSIL